MKIFAIFIACGVFTSALGQSVPNGSVSTGQVWTPSQWNTAWQGKVDARGGSLTNPTIAGGTANLGSASINGVTIPIYPQTAAESAAAVTPVNFTFPAGNILRYGADPTGVANSTAAIASALLTNTVVLLPSGTYQSTGNITLCQNGQRLLGQGRVNTTIVNTSRSRVTVKTCAGLNNIEIGDFSISRSVTPTSAGTGIDLSITLSSAQIHGLTIQGNFIGVKLGTTDYSYVRDLIVQDNLNDGIFMQNTAGDTGTLQWDIRDTLVQENGGNGVHVLPVSTSGGQSIIGPWRNLTTFANSGDGAILSGAAAPIQDIRIQGSFFGSDGNSEIFLDTYGWFAEIDHTRVELAGQVATGPSQATAPSGIGHGIQLTVNTLAAQIKDSTGSQNSFNGIFSQSPNLTVIGGAYSNNGLGSFSSLRSGIDIGSGVSLISGVVLGNFGGGKTQTFGVLLTSADNGTAGSLSFSNIVGNHFFENATAPIEYKTSPPAVTTTCNNSGVNASGAAADPTNFGPCASLSGTTGSIGGSSLASGACSTGTVSIAGSTTSMAVAATPATFPGTGFNWSGYVSTAGTVKVEVCNATGATSTPTSSIYNVRVLQ
jgi:hypothetical protein